MTGSDRLDYLIEKFKELYHPDIYKYGKCSEFAVALKLFLNGKDGRTITMKDLTTGVGDLYKHGLFHVCLFYDGYYWDVRGKQTETELLANDPTALNKDGNRKARIDEIQHLYNLLDKNEVRKIIQGLKAVSK